MPTVFREGGLRYFFYSNEGLPREPRHIHGREAKIWLDPRVEIAESFGFNSAELTRIMQVVVTRRNSILRAWHEHFGDSSPV